MSSAGRLASKRIFYSHNGYPASTETFQEPVELCFIQVEVPVAAGVAAVIGFEVSGVAGLNGPAEVKPVVFRFPRGGERQGVLIQDRTDTDAQAAREPAVQLVALSRLCWINKVDVFPGGIQAALVGQREDVPPLGVSKAAWRKVFCTVYGSLIRDSHLERHFLPLFRSVAPDGDILMACE